MNDFWLSVGIFIHVLGIHPVNHTLLSFGKSKTFGVLPDFQYK